jgi:hypothetical protein
MEWTPDGGSCLHLDVSGPAPLIADVRPLYHHDHHISESGPETWSANREVLRGARSSAADCTDEYTASGLGWG